MVTVYVCVCACVCVCDCVCVCVCVCGRGGKGEEMRKGEKWGERRGKDDARKVSMLQNMLLDN